MAWCISQMEDWKFCITVLFLLNTHCHWPPYFLTTLVTASAVASSFINMGSLALLRDAFQLVNHLKTLLTLEGRFGLAIGVESDQS